MGELNLCRVRNEANWEPFRWGGHHVLDDLLLGVDQLPLEPVHHVVEERENDQARVLFPRAKPRPSAEGDVSVRRERRVPFLVPRRVERLRVGEVSRVLVRTAHRPVDLAIRNHRKERLVT